MNKNKLAFIWGDIFVTIPTLLGIWNDLGGFGMKVISVIILGVAGGIAGVLGKELYERKLKPLIFKSKPPIN